MADYEFSTTKLDPADSVQLLTIDGTTPGYLIGSELKNYMRTGISNPNLLDNPFFTVNQRGWTTGITPWKQYFADRWCGTSPTMTVTKNSDGSFTFTDLTRTQVRQYIESQFFPFGKTVTLSIDAEGVSNGEVVIGKFYADEDAAGSWDGTPLMQIGDGERRIFTYTFNQSQFYNYAGVYFTIGGSVKVYSVKLELGTESTLAYDSAPNYASELLKCQRYYYKFHGVLTGMWLTSSLIRFSVPTPVKMRSTTVSVTYSLAQFHYGNAWHDYGSTPGMTLSATQFEDCVLINVTGVSSTEYNASWTELNIGISADL